MTFLQKKKRKKKKETAQNRTGKCNSLNKSYSTEEESLGFDSSDPLD